MMASFEFLFRDLRNPFLLNLIGGRFNLEIRRSILSVAQEKCPTA